MVGKGVPHVRPVFGCMCFWFVLLFFFFFSSPFSRLLGGGPPRAFSQKSLQDCANLKHRFGRRSVASDEFLVPSNDAHPHPPPPIQIHNPISGPPRRPPLLCSHPPIHAHTQTHTHTHTPAPATPPAASRASGKPCWRSRAATGAGRRARPSSCCGRSRRQGRKKAVCVCLCVYISLCRDGVCVRVCVCVCIGVCVSLIISVYSPCVHS